MRPGVARAAVALCLGLFAAGCAGVRPGGGEAVRIARVDPGGDATRRASLRLVSEGLTSDTAHQPGSALTSYERALSVDPTNPYAYLALARHYAELGQYARSLQYVDQAAVLLGSEMPDSPRAEAHLVGLRGWALRGMGRTDEGDALLVRAAQLAPSVWRDGVLSAAELQ